MTLEALHINDIKLSPNAKDEYGSRALVIKFFIFLSMELGVIHIFCKFWLNFIYVLIELIYVYVCVYVTMKFFKLFLTVLYHVLA